MADVSGDGRLDLIVENTQCCGQLGGVLGVLLGNGDGTFQPVVTYLQGADGWGTSLAVADVNGDGKLDAVATDSCGGNSCLNKGLVVLLLGNGDGTFQTPQTYDSGGFLTNSVATADLNGDGKPDLLVANICADDTLICTRSSVGVLLNNSVSNQSPTTTTLISSLNPSFVGQAVTFTATVTSTAGTPPNGETITFYEGSAVLGTAALSAGTAFLTTSSLSAGTFTITASYVPGALRAGIETAHLRRQHLVWAPASRESDQQTRDIDGTYFQPESLYLRPEGNVHRDGYFLRFNPTERDSQAHLEYLHD